MILFNDCWRRNYAAIYQGEDAFYDLGAEGFQSALATDLVVGEECVVASYKDLTKQGRKIVVFRWFKFSQVIRLEDDDGDLNRVFCGGFLREESLLKTEAAKQPPYAHFFNCKGHFKQQSVIRL